MYLVIMDIAEQNISFRLFNNKIYSMVVCFWHLSQPRGKKKPTPTMMTTSVEYRSVFDLCPNDKALIGLREVNSLLQTGFMQAANPGKGVLTVKTISSKCCLKSILVFFFPHIELDSKSQEDDRQLEPSMVIEVSDKMVCSACRCPFNNREEQVTTTSDTKSEGYHLSEIFTVV